MEMAFVLGLLVTLLLATVDLARWALAASALHEAARAGARVAAVCDPQDTAAAAAAVARTAHLQQLNALHTAGASGGGSGGGSGGSGASGGSGGSGGASVGSPPLITVTWAPAGCSASTCSMVRVELTSASLSTVSPWWPQALPLPAAWVEIPRESLRSTLNGRSNPACL